MGDPPTKKRRDKSTQLELLRLNLSCVRCEEGGVSEER